jgi:hypothetical protein
MTHSNRPVKGKIRRPTSGSMLALLVTVSIAACGTVKETPTEPTASQIAIFSGDKQVASADSMLPYPLSVQITDAGGRGVPNVNVQWRITSGEGELLGPSGRQLVLPVSVTNTDGIASVFVRFTMPGTSTVSASVLGVQLTFTTTVTKPPEGTISFGPEFDCTPFNDPSNFVPRDVTVPVGGKVVWVYAGWLDASCQAHITSTAVPPGGEPIDTGIMGPGGSSEFVPRVAGTWEYRDAINGGTGTITAKAP